MRRRAGKVLILSPHVMTAALVGWYVYDRRGSDRRFAGREAGLSYRAFVSPDGRERRCELDAVEFAAREPDALGAQLARAAQVPPNHSYP